MRPRQLAAVFTVVILGFAAKQFLSRVPEGAVALSGTSVDPTQMEVDYPNSNDLHVQRIHDLSVIYSDGD